METLSGIQSTNDEEFLSCNCCTAISISWLETFPLKIVAAVRYRPIRGSHATRRLCRSNRDATSSGIAGLYKAPRASISNDNGSETLTYLVRTGST
jgi:hypothetical protein